MQGAHQSDPEKLRRIRRSLSRAIALAVSKSVSHLAGISERSRMQARSLIFKCIYGYAKLTPERSLHCMRSLKICLRFEKALKASGCREMPVKSKDDPFSLASALIFLLGILFFLKLERPVRQYDMLPWDQRIVIFATFTSHH